MSGVGIGFTINSVGRGIRQEGYITIKLFYQSGTNNCDFLPLYMTSMVSDWTCHTATMVCMDGHALLGIDR